MTILAIIVGIIALCFGGVLLFGAPYLPTLKPQVAAALDLADLKPGELLLELGCGDGKVLIAAAQRDVRVIGYELNPILACIAWARTRRYRGLVTVVWGSFWSKPWPVDTAAIFVFLYPTFMERLDRTIIATHFTHTVKLVSFAFSVPNKEVVAEKQGVMLYHYPAR